MKIIRKMKGLYRKSLDIILLPFIYISAIIFRYIRKVDFWFQTFKRTKKLLLKVGIYPLVDHYYEPLFHPRHFYKSTREDRYLPGIDFNDKNQLEFLETLDYTTELENFPLKKVNDDEYYYNNDVFDNTDAQLYYQIIRTYKPKNIIEIGSGFSTKLSIAALKKNQEEDSTCKFNLTCIEPFEVPWLDKNKDIKLIRNKVEHVDKKIFKNLEKNDILFIDSSHIIRPQGDVLIIFLEIIPLIKSGVFIHIHDIYTPKDYYDIELDNFHFYNEQYLLEAFLSCNNSFEIIAANNYLYYHHFEAIKKKCPIISEEKGLGSIWIKRK